jgi:hypothetical protein
MNKLNLDSLRAAAREVSIPAFFTTWRGRHITFVTIGVLSIGLIAFIVKQAFFSTLKASETTPPSTPKKDATTPRTPSSFVNRLPFVTPAGTHERRITLQTPHSIRDQEAVVDAGNEDVLKNSHIPEKRFPVKMSTGQFNIATNEDLPEGIKSLNSLFTTASLIYVADFKINTNQMLQALKNEGWDDAACTKIVSFLGQLENVGKKGITTLYPQVSIESELLTHGPIHCSISKKDDRTVIVINNLLYAEGKSLYQLYLIAELKEDTAEVNVFCTEWAQEATHPASNVKELPCTRPEASVCIDFGSLLTTYTILPREPSENGNLPRVFNPEDLKQACGDLLELEQLNRLIEPILDALPKGLSLRLAERPDIPRIFKQGKQVVAHLFLQTDEGRLFEVSCSLSINSEFRFLGKNRFVSATLEGGFFAEWMKTEDGHHPLVTQFKDETPIPQMYE